MGADGGVCWMALQKPQEYERVRALLRPFYELTDYRVADWQENANMEWLDNNKDICAPNYLVGTYGTNQDHDLMQLGEILDSEPEDLCINANLTFAELLEELETRPILRDDGTKYLYLNDHYLDAIELSFCYYGNCQKFSALEIMLWSHFGSRMFLPRNKETFEIIEKMIVLDWQNELKDLLDYQNVEHQETWT